MARPLAPPEVTSGGAAESALSAAGAAGASGAVGAAGPAKMAQAAPRKPGRPRSAESEAAILRAALQLLAEQGYEEMSVEGVASRAGAGKATIYRRWPSKEALVAAALRRIVTQVQWPDTGSARQDMVLMMRGILGVVMSTGIHHSRYARVISSIAMNPSLMAIYWERVVLPAREAMRGILQRGIARGEVRQDLDVETVLDMLPGSIFFRVITASVHQPPTPEFVERVAETLWRGFVATE